MSFVTRSGPLFDGRAAAAIDDFCDDWEADYAQEVEDAIRTTGIRLLKHPTGNCRAAHRTRKPGDGYTR